MILCWFVAITVRTVTTTLTATLLEWRTLILQYYSGFYVRSFVEWMRYRKVVLAYISFHIQKYWTDLAESFVVGFDSKSWLRNYILVPVAVP